MIRENEPVDESRLPDLRAADADRDRVATLLRDHLGEGRLTLEEFSERVDAADASRTLGELDELTRDLPAKTPEPTADRSGRRPARHSIAVMSGIERKGRWRIEERTTALAVMGGIDLDLRSAEIVGSEIEIIAVAIMGGIQITVPEGVDVELTGLTVMGGKSNRVRDVPRLYGSPLVRVRAFTLMGGVDVRSRPRSLDADERPALPARG